jgi:alkylation response protein AidB-like acyl-CoA dehydrogenase
VAAGKYGPIGFNMPAEYGGGGVDDFRFNAVIVEEFSKFGPATPGVTLQNDIVGPYLASLATDEQKQRWLPGYITGELIGAIAMTEPGAGSDLAGIKTSAVRDGSSEDADWIVNGSKTYISAGINSDLVIVVARTDPEAGHRGFSLLVVERDMEGFTRGRKLDKMGLHAADTAELHFENVRVPADSLLGIQGQGCYHLMSNLPSERLSIAIAAIAGARQTWTDTLEYVKGRKAFGQPIGSFRHNRFVMAEMDTELEIAEQYVDRCLRAVVDGELTAVQAAKAKRWCTELGKRVVGQLRATARRIRLHERVQGGPRLRRRTHSDHLRRHDRDHERDHRARPWSLSRLAGVVFEPAFARQTSTATGGTLPASQLNCVVSHRYYHRSVCGNSLPR